MAECLEMEASWAPNGKVRLVLPLSDFLLLNWALWTTGAALEWDEKWFRELTGLSPAQVRALNDELTIVRFALDGSLRFISAVSGELRPPLEPSKTGIAAWIEGAKVAHSPIAERPRRHSKPHVSARNGGADVRLVAAGGRADGLQVRDVVHAVTSAARLDGEAVRDVKVLERFAFFSVPADEADRVIDAVDGVQVNGIALRVAPVPG